MKQIHNVGICQCFPTSCVIECVMSPRDERQILNLIKKLGVVRPRDLHDRRIPRGTLYGLYQKGLVQRQDRGLYVARDGARRWPEIEMPSIGSDKSRWLPTQQRQRQNP